MDRSRKQSGAWVQCNCNAVFRRSDRAGGRQPQRICHHQRNTVHAGWFDSLLCRHKQLIHQLQTEGDRRRSAGRCCGNGHEKEYEVTIDRPVTEEFLKKMASGLWLAELERKTLPCKVRKTGDKSFSIILTQGLNRQIRRMCQACGYRVHLLRRVRIMNIQLGGLKTGEYRKVTGEEYKRLIKLLEGSTSLSEADRRGKRYVAFHPRKEDQVNKWKQRSRE